VQQSPFKAFSVDHEPSVAFPKCGRCPCRWSVERYFIECFAIVFLINAAPGVWMIPSWRGSTWVSCITCRSLSKLRTSLSIAENTLYRQRKELKLIVVDYLQLVDLAGRYRENDSMRKVEAASTAMKEMAVEYGCPVLRLSQLSRGVESRDPPVPVLSDLRDSGSIEQDADVVMFCYRPEYYLERKIEGLRGATGSGSIATRADHEASISSVRNRLTIMTAKARGGPVGSCEVFCDIKNNHIADRAPQNDMMEDLIWDIIIQSAKVENTPQFQMKWCGTISYR
jgi:hypothetical protein